MPKPGPRRYKAETWDIMQYSFAKFNDHQARSVVRFDAHIDEERLKQAVDRLAIAFPLIKCRFSKSKNRPCWEEADFTANDMVFLKKTENNIDEEIQEAICSNINEFKGPQFKITVVRNHKADVLCIIINHMLCDGEGFKEVIYLLSSIYSHVGNDPAYSLSSRSVHQVLQTFNWKDKAMILFQKYGLSRHDNRVIFGLEGDRSTPFVVTHTISCDKFHSIKAYAKQYGATVNDVVLAAYIRTLHKTLGGRAVAIQCVVDLRKYLPAKKAEGFCNLTSNLVCDIGIVNDEVFHNTLMKVKKTMDTEKQDLRCLNLIMLLETLFGTMPYETAKRLVLKYYHNPPLAMSNLGIIDHSRLSFEGVHITEAFMTGSIKYNPLFQLALSTFDDQITFSVGFHGTLADKGKIQEFLMEIDNELHICEIV